MPRDGRESICKDTPPPPPDGQAADQQDEPRQDALQDRIRFEDEVRDHHSERPFGPGGREWYQNPPRSVITAAPMSELSQPEQHVHPQADPPAPRGALGII